MQVLRITDAQLEYERSLQKLAENLDRLLKSHPLASQKYRETSKRLLLGDSSKSRSRSIVERRLRLATISENGFYNYW